MAILTLHFYLALLTTILYHLLYISILPSLSLALAPKTYSNLTPRARKRWDSHAVSSVQCLVNSIMAIYLLICYSQERDPTTWRDRVYGYQSQTATVVTLSSGYFIWHLWETIVHVHLSGWIFVLHAAAAVLLISTSVVSPLFPSSKKI